jgi:HEAT repeat protein
MGEALVVEALRGMSLDPSGHVRTAAAWVMGETADAQFSDAARRLLVDPDPMVRKMALSALRRIKQGNAARQPALQ